MKNNKTKGLVGAIAVLIVAVAFGLVVNINLNGQTGETTVTVEPPTIEYSEDEVPAIIEGGQGEVIEDDTVPTVEAIDGGGKFEDVNTVQTFVPEEGVYYDTGAIEWVDTSSVDAFKDSTLGRCIIANNYYGAQCVSLARAFWWSYAGRDVSTCGTGLAKGMMNCAEQNAGSDFAIVWDVNQVQKGTWVVLTGSYTGHICMALGPVVNGYVACLGENQGGASCGANVGGSATNIINLSMRDFIGGYTPLSYIPPEPEPEPEPEPVTDTITYTYVKGDYFSKVLVKLGLDEGKLWGKNGTVRYYTQQLIEQNMLDARGNVKIGTPFTLTVR